MCHVLPEERGMVALNARPSLPTGRFSQQPGSRGELKRMMNDFSVLL